MTMTRTTLSTLRNILGALLVAATATTAVLPGTAHAKSERDSRLLFIQSEQVGSRSDTQKAKPVYVTQCAYISKKRKSYEPKHVKIKKFTTNVNCKKKFKNKVILRQFKMDQNDAQIKKNVSDQANAAR